MTDRAGDRKRPSEPDRFDWGATLHKGETMEPRYEYKFVRLGEGWLGVRKEARERYQEVIHDHARQGWRLVQVFAPGTFG